MTTENTHVADAYPLLPAVLAGLGGATGLIANALIGPFSSFEFSAWKMAALGFVIIAPMAFGFVVQRGDWIRSAIFAAGAGLISALILYFNGPNSTWGDSEVWRLVCLGIALFIAAPLFQAGRDGGYRPIAYGLAHNHAWTNGILWCLSWAFVAVTFILAFLLAGLFDLIGITALKTLLQQDWFWRAQIGLAFGLGLGMLRQQGRIVALMQQVAVMVLGVLAPVLAIGLGGFLLSLPFTGLDPLWRTNLSSTGILLACTAAALVLLNAVIGNGTEGVARHRVLRYAALVLAIVTLPLVVLAAIATGLRIDQYGFTPTRLWGLTFTFIAAIAAVTLIVAVVRGFARGQGDWTPYARRSNLNLAAIICGIALLLATPLISFNALSARDQVARLTTGQISADKFDWAALAFDFGAPGRAALQALTKSDDPAIRDRATAIEKRKSRYDHVELGLDPAQVVAADLAALDKKLRVLPQPVAVPDGLRRVLATQLHCGSAGWTRCTLYYTPDASVAFLMNDSCYAVAGDKGAAADAGVMGRDCTAPTQFALKSGAWTRSLPTEFSERPATQKQAAAAGFKNGQVELRTVPRRQIYVGGVPVGEPFE